MLGRVLGSLVYLAAAFVVAHSTQLSTAAQTALTLGLNSVLHAAEQYLINKGAK